MLVFIFVVSIITKPRISTVNLLNTFQMRYLKSGNWSHYFGATYPLFRMSCFYPVPLSLPCFPSFSPFWGGVYYKSVASLLSIDSQLSEEWELEPTLRCNFCTLQNVVLVSYNAIVTLFSLILAILERRSIQISCILAQPESDQIFEE
jgi:hypothetical protein